MKDVRIKVGVAKQRAKKRGLAFSLTSDDVVRQAQAQGWRCARTGIEFEPGYVGNHASPWSLSIDRIDPSRGYDPANIQLVVWSYNAVKSDYDQATAESIVARLASGLRAHRTSTTPSKQCVRVDSQGDASRVT